MPGKGHYKLFAYKSSVWYSTPGSYGDFDIYDLYPTNEWWDAGGWTYRTTLKVAMDPHGEPSVPNTWHQRAYAYTEWEWYTQEPIGTNVWVSSDGTYWDIWGTDVLLEDCFFELPYGWKLLKKDVYYPY